MASNIRWGEQGVWVSNIVLLRLLDFAEEVGRATAKDVEENTLVDKLIAWRAESYFQGIDVDLEVVFPLLSEKKLWARVFLDLARRVFRRDLGDHEVTFWQSETIAVARSIGIWLVRAVQAQQQGWHPETEDGIEASAWHTRKDR